MAQVVSFGCEVVETFFETFWDGQDRAELVLMYRRANQELSRLRAELSQRTLEVLELRQDLWGVRILVETEGLKMETYSQYSQGYV